MKIFYKNFFTRFCANQLYSYSAICITCVFSLNACAPLILGTAGAGIVVAKDRRMVAIQTIDFGMQSEAKRILQHSFGSKAAINVTVFNRRMLLTGLTANFAIKEEAEKLLHNKQKPQIIFNEIIVPTSSSQKVNNFSDISISSAVKAALVATRGIPSSSISVTTFNKTVYLMGLVNEIEAKAAAITTSKVFGVEKVIKLFEIVEYKEKY